MFDKEVYLLFYGIDYDYYNTSNGMILSWDAEELKNY